MEVRVLVVLLCFLVGECLSKVLPWSCTEVKDGLCGHGQYVFYKNIDQAPMCLTCPDGTYMEQNRHLCEACKNHTWPRQSEVIAQHGGPTSDNIIVCRPGFYRKYNSSLQLAGLCEPCEVCTDGMWAAQECGFKTDTLCCSKDMVAVDDEAGLRCALSHLYKHGSRLLKTRKVRSSSALSGASGSGVIAQDKIDMNNATEIQGARKKVDEQEKANEREMTSEEEVKRRMVEFPIWGQFLCAGIAVSIFLFYLGVGIPCNVCGSLDKLRQLKSKLTRSNERRPDEDNLNKAMTSDTVTARV